MYDLRGYLTITDFCRHFDISRKAVYNAIHDGRIVDCPKVGNVRFIRAIENRIFRQYTKKRNLRAYDGFQKIDKL